MITDRLIRFFVLAALSCTFAVWLGNLPTLRLGAQSDASVGNPTILAGVQAIQTTTNGVQASVQTLQNTANGMQTTIQGLQTATGGLQSSLSTLSTVVSGTIVPAVQDLQSKLAAQEQEIEKVKEALGSDANTLTTPFVTMDINSDTIACRFVNVAGAPRTVHMEVINVNDGGVVNVGGVLNTGIGTFAANGGAGQLAYKKGLLPPEIAVFCRFTVTDGSKSDIRAYIATAGSPLVAQ